MNWKSMKLKSAGGNTLLYAVVEFLINNGLCQNTGKFKKGDLVKYNWKAKAYIQTVWKENRGLKRITGFTNYSDGSQGCDYESLDPKEYSSGCDAFWLRKAYWWERPHNGI